MRSRKLQEPVPPHTPSPRAQRRDLERAVKIILVGYSFTKTDAQARMELLEAIEKDNCGVDSREVHLVLGPNTEDPNHRRVAELVRPRLGTTRASFIDRLEPGHTRSALVIRHPPFA